MPRGQGEFEELSPYRAEAGGGSGAGEPVRRRGRGAAARVETDAPEMRPRGIGELLDLAAEVFRSRFGVYVGLSTLLWFPVYFARPFLAPDEWLSGKAGTPSAGVFLGFLVTLAASLVVRVLVNAIVARLVAAELLGEALSVPAAIQGVLSRSFAIGTIAIATSLLTATGTFCLCIPGILVAWRLYVAPAVCVIEGTGIVESLSRGSQLSRGRFWPWLGLFVAGILLVFPFSSISGLADQPGFRDSVIRALGIPGFAFDWARVGFASLFTGVATAFEGVLVTVWYFDCRARNDGADLEARLLRFSSEPAPAFGGSEIQA